MSILKSFIKYQSLGNDFIVFDWYKRPASYMENELHSTAWKQFIARICDRHYGVGADGILIITNCPQAGMPEMLIFNADGSQAEMCLNGLRCVAHYLFITYKFPEHFSIKVGTRVIDCLMQQSKEQPGMYEVVATVGVITNEGTKTIKTAAGDFQGHVVQVGNPHFIVFDTITQEMLQLHGKLIESHESFPNRTNVEFVWDGGEGKGEKIFNVMVYERGCGVTLACSSGAAAITGLLAEQGSIIKNQKIILHMLGGNVSAWVDNRGYIVLQAGAQQLFKGVLEDYIEEYRQLRPQDQAQI